MPLLVAALACAASAAWFASSWIDDPPDATCGSVWRTDVWADRDGCSTTMAVRAAIACTVASLPLAAWLLVRRRRLPAARLMAGCMGVAAVVVLANETVRAGGIWAG